MTQVRSSSTGKMLASSDGAVGWILFNNPARRNAVSLDMWESLYTFADEFARDPAIRVVVVRGVGGKAFVSGADISEFESQRSSAAAVEAYRQIADRATYALQSMGKPTIAMIEGYCIGGGLALALACDLRIAGEDARFGIPAARLGLGYEYPGVKKLVDVVGPAAAKEIFFTADQYDAREALALRLVNRVVPVASLEGYVRNYAGRIAGNAPKTVHAIKAIVADAVRDESQRDLAACQRLVDACFASEDYAEGRQAFMQKRPPVFRGV